MAELDIKVALATLSDPKASKVLRAACNNIVWELLGVHGPVAQSYEIPKDVVHHLRRFQVFQDSCWWAWRRAPDKEYTHAEVLMWFTLWLKMGEPHAQSHLAFIEELKVKYPAKPQESSSEE